MKARRVLLLLLAVVTGVLCLPIGYHLVHSAPRQEAPSASAPPVHLVFGKAAELETVAGDYVVQHGLAGFMDQWYNLAGTKPQAEFNHGNHALAQALGLGVPEHQLPLTIDRVVIRDLLPQSRIDADRRLLARFFADAGKTPNLGEAQRLFLEWHFAAPRNYSSVLYRTDRHVAVGWNIWAELCGRDDFEMYTFGQLGCTSVFADAADGCAHLSHYDDVVNQTQVYVLFDFLDRHGEAEVYVNGVYARELAQFLHEDRGLPSVYVHVKRLYTQSMYAIRFVRTGGRLNPSHCEKPVSADYLSSVVNGEYGRWFPFGRFSQTFCGDDADFVPTRYEVLDGSPQQPASSPIEH